MVAGSRDVYFAGDTDLFPGMADLGGRLDVALLDLGLGAVDRAPGTWTHAGRRRPSPSCGRAPRSRSTGGPTPPTSARRTPPQFLSAPAQDFDLAAELAPSVEVHVFPVGGTLPLTDTGA